MKTELVKISTYARSNNKSLAWAYQQVKNKKVKSKKIDGTTFVIVKV